MFVRKFSPKRTIILCVLLLFLWIFIGNDMPAAQDKGLATVATRPDNPSYVEPETYNAVRAQRSLQERVAERCSRSDLFPNEDAYRPHWFRSSKESYARLAYDKLFRAHTTVIKEKRMLFCFKDLTTTTPMENILRKLIRDKKNHNTLLKSYEKFNSISKLESSTKFMIIRDPIDKLVSEFTAVENIETSSMSFEQFIREKNQLYNSDLWLSDIQICQPCLTRYDFFLKYEHLVADATFLLTHLGLTIDKQLLAGRETNSRDFVEYHLNQLSEETKQELITNLHNDLDMFQYEYYS